MKLKLLSLVSLLLLSGCASSQIAKVLKAAGNDHAAIKIEVNTIYGNMKFTRVNAPTNQTTSITPDGTFTTQAIK